MGFAFRNQHEFCLVLEKGKVEYNKKDFSNVQRMTHIKHNQETHPHEKGVPLLGKMILPSTNENDLILDPFMGSGTTLVAAKQLSRKAVGIEISEKYCEIARERLKQDMLF